MEMLRWLQGLAQRAMGIPVTWLPSWQGGRPAWTDWSVEKAIREGYRAHDVVYSCVKRLSDAASSVPWVLKRRTEDGDEEVTDHPLAELLRRPNPRFSWQDMMQYLTLDLHLGGNAYWLLIREGKAQQLWRLRPDWVKPLGHPTLLVSGYEYTVGHEKTTLPVYDAERGMAVIHFRMIDPGNDLIGLSPLQAASRVVDTDNAAINWNFAALENQARPPGALCAPKSLNDAQYARLKKQIDDQVAGAKNARRPLLLEGGMAWQQHGFSPTDMDFLAGQAANSTKICNIFGVRPEWLGALEAKFENAREGRRMTWEDTIISFLVDVKGTMALQLVPLMEEEGEKGELFLDFDLSRTPAVLEARGELIEQAKNVWSMGVPFNQVNDQFGLGFDPVEGGDVGYLPAILLPVGSEAGTESDGGGEQGASSSGPMMARVLDLETEEQKTALWRAFDRSRQAWERGVAVLVKKRFAAELAVLVKQLEAGVRDLDMAIGNEAPVWEDMLSAIWQAVFQQFGKATAKALGMELKQAPGPSSQRVVWDPWPAEVQSFVANTVGDHIDDIGDATKLAVREEIAAGLAASETAGQIARRLQALYDGFGRNRSFVIARTEVGAAANSGTHEAAKQSRVVKTHTWISSRDDRVRDSHKPGTGIDGQTRPFDERYSNGCMQPCDPAGPAGETIQCRCVESFGTEKAK